MSFDFECEVCKKLVNKMPYKLSISQHITNGGIIECKECKRAINQNFALRFYTARLGLVVYLWLHCVFCGYLYDEL